MIHDVNNLKQKSLIKMIVMTGLVFLIVLNFTETVNIVKKIYGVFFPLLLGSAIAYILNILMSEYEKIYFPKSTKKLVKVSRRGVSILLSVVTIVVILIFFVYILVPQIKQFIDLLMTKFPVIYDTIAGWVLKNSDQIPVVQEKLVEFKMDGTTALNKGVEIIGNWAGGTVSLVGTIFGGVMNYVIAGIFSIYILFSKESLKSRFEILITAYIRGYRREKLYSVLRIADETFSNYFVGQLKEAVILGLLCTVGMVIFRFPYATIIGPVVGLTALIPIIGAYIGALVGFLLILVVDPIKAIFFVLFIVILQQIEGNVIYPKVVGKSIGLPGIWVFAAITVGGGLLGIAGVILGVPIFATFYKLLSESAKKRLNLVDR